MDLSRCGESEIEFRETKHWYLDLAKLYSDAANFHLVVRSAEEDGISFLIVLGDVGPKGIGRHLPGEDDLAAEMTLALAQEPSPDPSRKARLAEVKQLVEDFARYLYLPRLKDLFGGRIENWREVGGPDAPVHVVRRPPNSGTHQLFRELVLDEEDYAPEATILPTTAAVVDAVRHDEAAVGLRLTQWRPGLRCRRAAASKPECTESVSSCTSVAAARASRAAVATRFCRSFHSFWASRLSEASGSIAGYRP